MGIKQTEMPIESIKQRSRRFFSRLADKNCLIAVDVLDALVRFVHCHSAANEAACTATVKTQRVQCILANRRFADTVHTANERGHTAIFWLTPTATHHSHLIIRQIDERLRRRVCPPERLHRHRLTQLVYPVDDYRICFLGSGKICQERFLFNARRKARTIPQP